jgi:hypothetical protein
MTPKQFLPNLSLEKKKNPVAPDFTRYQIKNYYLKKKSN